MGISFHGLFNNVHAAQVYVRTGNKIPDCAIAARRAYFSYESELAANEQQLLAIYRSENRHPLYHTSLPPRTAIF